ncbi:cathelicidin-related antimicrobial peptide Bf-CRAMP-like [Polyodon spathula]|uniref:cathelicidin-related antimicrobial peptide Bf-CRAMP-like n=1 Tax=Polyodon spathula TaxID=7913 RepID=UPI001B7E39E5|nr:cathelicidin-related antimicrobial peptide Bf-CRAMP-like [Polyodon spathula]
MKSLLALLFCIGALVASTGAQLPYSQLPEQHRRAIDLAVEYFNSKLNTKSRQSFRFFRLVSSVHETKLTSNRFHLNLNFILRATECLLVEASNVNDCEFRKDGPRVDCFGCFIAERNNVEKQKIDCVQRNKVTEEIQRKRNEECNPDKYRPGEGLLLASRGCKGCY